LNGTRLRTGQQSGKECLIAETEKISEEKITFVTYNYIKFPPLYFYIE